jgi:hypothetical protein
VQRPHQSRPRLVCAQLARVEDGTSNSLKKSAFRMRHDPFRPHSYTGSLRLLQQPSWSLPIQHAPHVTITHHNRVQHRHRVQQNRLRQSLRGQQRREGSQEREDLVWVKCARLGSIPQLPSTILETLVWTEKPFTDQMSATSRVKTIDDPPAPEISLPSSAIRRSDYELAPLREKSHNHTLTAIFCISFIP